MRPFLQDVLMFRPLFLTLLKAQMQDSLTPFKILPHVGVASFLDFLYHFAMLGWYTFLARNIAPILLEWTESDILNARAKFDLRRLAEGWKFGAGLDYYDH